MPSLIRKKRAQVALDWQVARERLSRLAANDGTPDPAERDRVLSERAQKLATRPAAPARATAAEIELLTFVLGKERYAIETHCLHQVLTPSELTRLPGAPSIWRGVTNLRGEIFPVIDLREILEAELAPPSETARWLLIGSTEPEFCLCADAVLHLFNLDSGALETTDREGRFRHTLVRGVTRDGQSVLDTALLLTHRQLFIGDASDPRQETTS